MHTELMEYHDGDTLLEGFVAYEKKLLDYNQQSLLFMLGVDVMNSCMIKRRN